MHHSDHTTITPLLSSHGTSAVDSRQSAAVAVAAAAVGRWRRRRGGGGEVVPYGDAPPSEARRSLPMAAGMGTDVWRHNVM